MLALEMKIVVSRVKYGSKSSKYKVNTIPKTPKITKEELKNTTIHPGLFAATLFKTINDFQEVKETMTLR